MDPSIAETATRIHTPMWGVACFPCNAPSILGISLSWAIAKLTRTAVFIAASVVPRTASATVNAMTIMNTKPLPPNIASPMSLVRSPMGAPDAAAASMPVSLLPSAATYTSFSHTA